MTTFFSFLEEPQPYEVYSAKIEEINKDQVKEIIQLLLARNNIIKDNIIIDFRLGAPLGQGIPTPMFVYVYIKPCIHVDNIGALLHQQLLPHVVPMPM